MENRHSKYTKVDTLLFVKIFSDSPGAKADIKAFDPVGGELSDVVDDVGLAGDIFDTVLSRFTQDGERFCLLGSADDDARPVFLDTTEEHVIFATKDL